MKAPVSFTEFQQQQNLCNKNTVQLLGPSGPAWTHLSMHCQFTINYIYEPFQKEKDKKDGASTNWLRGSLRKGTFGINKSFSQYIYCLQSGCAFASEERSSLSETKAQPVKRRNRETPV